MKNPDLMSGGDKTGFHCFAKITDMTADNSAVNHFWLIEVGFAP